MLYKRALSDSFNHWFDQSVSLHDDKPFRLFVTLLQLFDQNTKHRRPPPKLFDLFCQLFILLRQLLYRQTYTQTHTQTHTDLHTSDVASVLTPRSRGRVEAQYCLGSLSPRTWYASASSRSRALKTLVSVSPRSRLKRPRAHPWHRQTERQTDGQTNRQTSWQTRTFNNNSKTIQLFLVAKDSCDDAKSAMIDKR